MERSLPQHQHQYRAESGNTGGYPDQTISFKGNTNLSFYLFHPLNCLSLSSIELQGKFSFFLNPVLLRQLLASDSMSVRCNCFYPQHSSHSHADPILLGFRKTSKQPQFNRHAVFCLIAICFCCMSDLRTAAHCVSTVQSVWVFPLSNVSDIPGDPCLAALCSPESQWDKFLCFRYQLFIKCPALARLGLATFVRIVDRYIGEWPKVDTSQVF